MEKPFDILPGVIATTSGYTGGVEANPRYHDVGGGKTGHRESGAFFYLITLVPVRPRSRGERRSLRTLSPGVRHPPRTPRFQSRKTHRDAFQLPSDAFRLHPSARAVRPRCRVVRSALGDVLAPDRPDARGRDVLRLRVPVHERHLRGRGRAEGEGGGEREGAGGGAKVPGADQGASASASTITLVPIRSRRRGARRSLRTLPGASLRPGSLAFNPRPRRLSTPLLTPFNFTPTSRRSRPRSSTRLRFGPRRCTTRTTTN